MRIVDILQALPAGCQVRGNHGVPLALQLTWTNKKCVFAHVGDLCRGQFVNHGRVRKFGVKTCLKALEVGGFPFKFEHDALSGIGHPAGKREFLRQPENIGPESHALNNSANDQPDPFSATWCGS
jgi:hypothetical protein